MTLEEMKQRYAYTLAKVGLNVQPNQTVLVEAGIEGADFVPIFAKECYRLQAKDVVVHYLDYALLKEKAQARSAAEVAEVFDTERAYYQKFLDEKACYVRLETVHPFLMEDVDDQQASAIFERVDGIRNIMRKASREKHCQWLIAMIPTEAWAKFILPASTQPLEDLWRLLLQLCYIEKDNDIVETWRKKSEKNQTIAQKLDALHLRQLHYQSSSGTDLIVQLNPYSKFAHPKQQNKGPNFQPNIPTEEVAVSPEKYGTSGVVFASKPLVLAGKRIEQFGFRFQDGKVVEVIGEQGKQQLEALIGSDENAGYLGEAALVEYHSPISQSNVVYYTTLIDENASCHLALGRALDQPLSEDGPYHFNQSKIHIDFMIGTEDLSIIGIDEQGQEIQVFKDGDFAL